MCYFVKSVFLIGKTPEVIRYFICWTICWVAITDKFSNRMHRWRWILLQFGSQWRNGIRWWITGIHSQLPPVPPLDTTTGSTARWRVKIIFRKSTTGLAPIDGEGTMPKGVIMTWQLQDIHSNLDVSGPMESPEHTPSAKTAAPEYESAVTADVTTNITCKNICISEKLHIRPKSSFETQCLLCLLE